MKVVPKRLRTTTSTAWPAHPQHHRPGPIAFVVVGGLIRLGGLG